MADIDDTWKFWSRFVFEDCRPYISLYVAIRSENWFLRLASVKSMAANFTVFNHPMYQKLISQHIMDVLHMPAELVKYFQKKCLHCILGKVLHSVGLDESHEMLISKDVKQAVVRPSKDSINCIVNYIPYRVKNIDNFKSQILPRKKTTTSKATPIMYKPDHTAIKSSKNVMCILEKVKEYELFPCHISENSGLANPFWHQATTAAKKHD